jgi:tetratricopeptide (TPR) repeat protein
MRPGRNDPCPCGSTRKFKHCCGRPGTTPPTAAVGVGAAAVGGSGSAVPTGSRAAVARVSVHEIGALVELLNTERSAEAEARSAALLRMHPAEGMLWKILSVALLRQNKDALATLRRAAELLPRDAEAHANLGAELRGRGEWEAALASLRQSLALQPRNPDVLVDAGDVQRALGRAREAVTLYQLALQIDPGRGEVHNNLGNAFLALGENTAAVECYRRALELRRNDAQILCNLGNALRQTGELEEAMTCTRRALELAPALSMASNNLGLLLAARGERDGAISYYREALKHNPRYVEALINLGTALRQQGQRREALAAHQQAVELDPKRADSHSNLGHTLLESRRVREAAESFRSALALQPDHVVAHLGLATAQRVQGLGSEAEATCEAALVLAPQNHDALMLLGELRADRGEFARAQELFERVRIADPECASAYCSIAAHRRMTRNDASWLQGAEALLHKPQPLAEEIQLRYALGKYFDDIGEYDLAFSNHLQANELTKRYGGRYDAEHLTALVDRIIERCDAGFVRAQWPAASTSQEPIFIIGMPRSGTSLTEQILASHPAVFGGGEISFWDRAFTGVEESAFAGAAELAPQREDLAQRLADVGQRYLQRLRERAGGALRITDKMPANFFYAGLIHAVLPRARIIHLQRHPLDTCLSVYFQNFFYVSPYANDLNHLAHYYGQYLRIMAHWRSVLPEHALLEVPYEGLVRDAERWTRRMLEFIGLPWDPQCLEFHQTRRSVITVSKWQVRQQINSGSVGRWRNYEKYLAPLRHLAPNGNLDDEKRQLAAEERQ